MDARGDRGVGTPTVRIQHGKTPSGRKLQESISCHDDGRDGDAAKSDRLWRCKGSVTVTAGEGTLVLVDGAGGDAERLLEELPVKLVPGRSLRWTWTARPKAWPANKLAEEAEGPLAGKTARGAAAVLEAFAEGSGSAPGSAPGLDGGMPDAPSADGGKDMQGPRGPGGLHLTRRIALPLSYESPARTASLPRELLTPSWPVLVAMPGALVGVAAIRRVLGVIAAWAVRRRRRVGGVRV